MCREKVSSDLINIFPPGDLSLVSCDECITLAYEQLSDTGQTVDELGQKTELLEHPGHGQQPTDSNVICRMVYYA